MAKRYITIFALLTFLLQIVAPFAALSQENTAGEILICTANGYQWITPEQDSPNTPDTRQNHCPLCLIDGDKPLKHISPSSQPVHYISVSTLSYGQKIISHSVLSLQLLPPGRAPPFTLQNLI